jgi:ATP-dependent protease ClpP protease subunit/uncharacterized coiled-coil protein SlyX
MANKVAVFKFKGVIATKEEAEYFDIKEYVSANDIELFLESNKDASTLRFDIESPGGNADQAFIMYDKIKAAKATGIKIQTIGFSVHSAATLPYVTGDERLISPNAGFTPHNAAYMGMGDGERLTKEKLRNDANELEVYDNKMLNIYASELQLSEADKNRLSELMVEDKNIGADGAIELGFATGIYNDQRQLAASVKSVGWTNRIAASIMNNNNKEMETKETNKLLDKLSSTLGVIAKKLGIKAEGEGEVTAATTNLSDGTVLYSDVAIAVDVKVYTDEAMTTPAPDGDHELEDGRTITVSNGDGTVTAIADPPVATDEKDKEIEALKQQLADKEKEMTEVTAQVKEVVTAMNEIKKSVQGSNNPNDVDEFEGKKFEDLTPVEKHRFVRNQTRKALSTIKDK